MTDDLTTGWEPDLEPGDTLLRQFVLANADRNEAMARMAGGSHMRTSAFAAADPGSPVIFDNAAVLLQPPQTGDIDAAVDEIVAFYPSDRHFVVLSAFPTPDLRAHGLELMGHPPLMYRPAGGSAPPISEDLRIAEVVDARMLQDFVATLVEAYPMPGAQRTPLADPRLLGGTIRLFVGYVDGHPVATAGARIGHGLNDVEWVSTKSAFRRRGIGAALSWAATLSDPTLPAALIASDDGQPVYRAMGFVPVVRLTMWHRPPAP